MMGSQSARSRRRPGSSSTRSRNFDESSMLSSSMRNGAIEPPMESSMIYAAVVEDGSMLAFACYDEERNEIVLDASRRSGQDTANIVERFIQTTRPSLILVGNKIVNNEPLLKMLTTLPVTIPEEEAALDGNSRSAGQDQATVASRGGTSTVQSESQSIPYRLLKTGSFDFRKCQALILQKLRVLTLHRPRTFSQHPTTDNDGEETLSRHSQSMSLEGDFATYLPSRYNSLAAIIDFEVKAQVQALGALLSFLQGSTFRFEEDGMITVNQIIYAKSSRHMSIDAHTFAALHIFATEHHPLLAGGQGQAKEGWSLFSLLDRTKSKGGRQLLRDWMLQPLVDAEAIIARQNVVELFIDGRFETSAGVLFELLGRVGPIDKILLRMQKCTTQPSDFLILTRTLSAAVAVSNVLSGDILRSLNRVNRGKERYHILYNVVDSCQANVLLELQEAILNIVDEEATSIRKDTVVIRRGFSPELDEWKDQYECLEDTLEQVGSEIKRTYPEIRDLSVVFIPQVGFLVALDKVMVMSRVLQIPQDFTHIFNQDDSAYFKSTEVRDLDIKVGDLDGMIKDRESMIVTELEDKILDSEFVLRECFTALSVLDCLLSFADCALDLGFTRPKIFPAPTRRISVKGGRHPLQEIITETPFVPNDIHMDEKERVLIVTGPNFSGKSCYLRQVGVLVFMAHIGCFLPCKEAEISLTDQICARISTVETCAVPQSSFQSDLTRMSSILLKCTSSSLVLIDEFGKGTSPTSGIAILGAALQKFSEIQCRTVCTTHFLELFSMNIMKDGENGIKARQMAIHLPKDGNDDACPIFKLRDGVASSSAGLICARRAGLNKPIIQRAKYIQQTWREKGQVKPMQEACPESAELTLPELELLESFLSVSNWEDASQEDLRLLIQKVARVEPC